MVKGLAPRMIGDQLHAYILPWGNTGELLQSPLGVQWGLSGHPDLPSPNKPEGPAQISLHFLEWT